MPRKSLTPEERRSRGHNIYALLAIQAAGGATQVARKFGYAGAWSVSRWIETRVPAERVRDLCSMGDNIIKPWQVRPDIFDEPREVGA